MSYILDALKKIEHEKSKKPALDGRVSISGDLFHERIRKPARAGIWKIVAIIAAASLMAGGGTWFLLQGNNNKSSGVTQQLSPKTVTSLQPLPAISTPVQPVLPSVPVAPPPAAKATASAVANKRAEPIEDEQTSSRAVRRFKKRNSVVSYPSLPQVQMVQAPGDIKLSGIAWQDQRSGRRAVVNGFLLKEGSMVSGAKITDIFANRVRFTSQAGQFEIRLDGLTPTEMKK